MCRAGSGGCEAPSARHEGHQHPIRGNRVVRKALILGDPNSIFSREQAAFWRSHGIEVGIVTRHWSGDQVLPDGTPVLASSAHETPRQKRAYLLLQKNLERLENFIIRRQRARYEQAL